MINYMSIMALFQELNLPLKSETEKKRSVLSGV